MHGDWGTTAADCCKTRGSCNNETAPLQCSCGRLCGTPLLSMSHCRRPCVVLQSYCPWLPAIFPKGGGGEEALITLSPVPVQLFVNFAHVQFTNWEEAGSAHVIIPIGHRASHLPWFPFNLPLTYDATTLHEFCY